METRENCKRKERGGERGRGRLVVTIGRPQRPLGLHGPPQARFEKRGRERWRERKVARRPQKNRWVAAMTAKQQKSTQQMPWFETGAVSLFIIFFSIVGFIMNGVCFSSQFFYCQLHYESPFFKKKGNKKGWVAPVSNP